MENKKIIVLSTVLVALPMLMFVLSNQAFAQNNMNSTLVQTLITKFNLNGDEVNKVVNEFKTQKQQDRLKDIETKLNQAVNDKKITIDQKNKLLTKIKDNQAKKLAINWINLSKEDKQKKHEEFRTEMHNWLTQNGFTTDLMKSINMGMRHGKNMNKGGMGRF